ncbi:MAG TPA: oligosaccharide flippase family protein [Nocardioides sp.]|uniref:lipopolysaccharide biosynthesis protein n=1 Tax=Nocardioides sp. TaxID=35761 RepID=UPI002D7F725F|nr:oligosaccharide flippase family protein [Nocardioides sp.]HET6652582.1 oligosaccharide flippase family protein [Nocardioides sp.]
MTNTRTRNQLLTGSLVIAVAMGVMNVTTYGFTILAARVLGPVEYGALAAVMGLLIVLNVLSLGLQATGARRVAAAPERREVIEREVIRTTYRCALGLGLLALLAAPLVSAALDLDSWALAALIAVTVVPLTVMGGQAGVLQGEQRWGPLAGIYLGAGLGRLAFGAVILTVRTDTFGAMVGVAAGAFVPAVVGWWALRHPSRRNQPAAPAEPREGVLRETMHNSHALLAFFALTNVDVVAARIVLDEHQAGLYAGGLILTKAVLFLPQFVVVVVFPSMSRSDSARRINLIALGLVAAIGLVVVLGVALLPDLAVVFVGGPEYAELADLLWVFALLGTVLAMLQLMIYNIVARQRQRIVYVVWAALALVAVASPFADSVPSLLRLVLVIDTVLLGALLAVASRRGSPTSA